MPALPAPEQEHSEHCRRSGRGARAPFGHAHRAPAGERDPADLFRSPSLVNAAGLDATTQLPGFPTDSFLAFALAVPFIQGALFSTMNAGTDLARDIQTGFLNRLSLTSMRGSALLAGQLGGIVVLGFVQAVIYVVVGLIVGVEFASGPLGIVVLLLFSLLVSLGFGALGAFLALRTGSGEAIQEDLPAPLRLPLPLVDECAPGADRRRLVPLRRHDQPGLVSDRVRPQPDHHRLGLDGARARVRDRGRDRRVLARPRRVGVVART